MCEEERRSNEGWTKAYVTALTIAASLKKNQDGDFTNMDEVSEKSDIVFKAWKKSARRDKGEKVDSPMEFQQ
eukprot:snap_masked-scaffold_3-processed-gene-7.0-mRNA-1 protein AED:1.00 eAED:1.00 QI:0/-1/0/0/-1/1/1/0/71